VEGYVILLLPTTMRLGEKGSARILPGGKINSPSTRPRKGLHPKPMNALPVARREG